MPDSAVTIKNARIVNEGRIFEADLRILGGRIDAIGSDLAAAPGGRVLDVAGAHVLPGFIDDQVHFREPGLTHKGDMASESAAAVAGGITSFMDMPNVKPATVSRTELAGKYARANGRASANYAFYLGATNDNIDEIRALQPGEACGVKVFMGSSTGRMLVDDPGALHRIFAESPVLIATHCEDSPMIWANEEIYRERYGDDVPMAAHPRIRSAEACFKSSSFAVQLAREHGTRLHVLHLTTARELELFDAAPLTEKAITAEVCVHHLFYDESRYEDLGSLIKCNPAIKTVDDRNGLLDGLRDGRLDVIATDHAPHTREEKSGKYFDAPAGLPLVQDALLCVLEHYHDQRLPLELIVTKTSHSVADLFAIEDRGYIREGYWADLVVVDLDGETQVSRSRVLSRCGWSPFEGCRFRSSIRATLVNGTIVFEDGELTGAIVGQRLRFGERGGPAA